VRLLLPWLRVLWLALWWVAYY